jgi:signal transduction histidine kinase
VAVVLRLQHRARAATALTRRSLTPVVTIAGLRAGLLAVIVVAWWVEPMSAVVRAAMWMLALMVPLIALAFLVGLVRWRLYAGRALERLAGCLDGKPDAARVRFVFAEAFEDPAVQIAFPTDDSGSTGWIDSQGRPVSLPPVGSGLVASVVGDEGRTIAVVVHDAALEGDPALLHAGLAMAGVALENRRLVLEADGAMREVKASRARIAASGERERRRIERDLHDGAQQRLVALRIELGLAEELVRRDAELGARRLRELEHDVDEALEELRALAHGVYPPLLADCGLPDALRSVTARAAVPVRLEVRDVGRYVPEVESAVYYCVLEALQNVLKHARSARCVEVLLDGGELGELRLRVQDDGPGFAEGSPCGAGITNMRDRLVALGGEMAVNSTLGAGTLVEGVVPTDGRAQEGT